MHGPLVVATSWQWPKPALWLHLASDRADRLAEATLAHLESHR